MKSRNQFFITQCLVLLLSFSWGAAANAQKVVVSEAIPNNAEQGTVSLNVQIKGRGFQNGANVAFWRTGTTNPGGITVNAVTVHDSKNLTANIDVDDLADIDLFDIEVFNTNGRKGKGITLFSVKQKGGPNETDTTPPDPITDFRVDGRSAHKLRLLWTSTGDDGNTGSTDHFELLQAKQASLSVCDGAGPYDFSNSIPLPPPNPLDPGTERERWAGDLDPESCYAFSVEPFDEVGNTPGASVTVGKTIALPADYWTRELVDQPAFGNTLAFDPDTDQPVILGRAINDSTHFYRRSTDGSWSDTELTGGNSTGSSVSLEFNTIQNTFGAAVQSTRSRPNYLELQSDGSWNSTSISRDRSNFSSQALAFDPAGLPVIAFQKPNDRNIYLASSDGSSFTIDQLPLPSGVGPHLRFEPTVNRPMVIAFKSFTPCCVNYTDTLYLATFDGGWSVETAVANAEIWDSPIIGHDTHGRPVLLYLERLREPFDYWIRMIRKDATATWTSPTTIDPDAPVNQHAPDMEFAADGTLFVIMGNEGDQVRVGRVCQAGLGLQCESTTAPAELNTWVWETVAESVRALSIAIDDSVSPSTIAIIASGDADALYYYRCDTSSASVICGSPPAP